MESISYKAAAPGSVMLFGEYAVLHGKQAIVCAINKRMHVTVRPRADKQIFISSSLGFYQTSLTTLQIESPFEFVLATIKECKRQMKVGCDIEIYSDFSEKMGFGSSAAVTVALLACLDEWLTLQLDRKKMLMLAKKIIRKVQGTGSGADAAASIMGGVVAYRMQNCVAKTIATNLPLALVFSGYKTKTADAIARMKNFFNTHKKIVTELFNTMDSCAQQAIKTIGKEDWDALGKLMNIQQGIMHSLAVSDDTLDKLISALRREERIFGAKISGSGLGDCVIGLGNVAENFAPPAAIKEARYIPVSVAERGVVCEKI